MPEEKHDLMTEFHATEPEVGLYLLQRRGSGSVIGLGGMNEEEGASALCLFKTEMDALEYLNNWVDAPEEWMVVGSNEAPDSLIMVRQASLSYTHVAINPPLTAQTPFLIMDIDVFADYFEDAFRKGGSDLYGEL